MITQNLAHNIVKLPLENIPGEVIHEAKRSFLNWLGCAVGAHSHPSVSMMLNVSKKFESSSQATLIGTSIKTDLGFAALINGMTSHIFDFDDTFLDTILHPSAPVFPAILAWAEYKSLPGDLFLRCFAVGVEVEQRIAQAVCPSHYDNGWHVTGTVGAFGAVAALGKMLCLDEIRMTYAIGLASTQPTGLREMFGTMTKPFHPGKAASNGLLAVLMAQEGYTSSTQPLEAKRGYCAVLSERPDFRSLEAEWGKDWHIMKNTYKPFACGVVNHPIIDAAIKLKSQGVSPDDIQSITLQVHPLVLELTGIKDPKDQLQAKFSVYHCAAVALVDGKAGAWQFTDEKVLDEDVIALRRKIKVEIDNQICKDQTVLKAILKNGDEAKVFIEHALGSLEHPLSDKDIEEKFMNLTEPYLSHDNQKKIIELVWCLDELSSIKEIITLCQEA